MQGRNHITEQDTVGSWYWSTWTTVIPSQRGQVWGLWIWAFCSDFFSGFFPSGIFWASCLGGAEGGPILTTSTNLPTFLVRTIISYASASPGTVSVPFAASISILSTPWMEETALSSCFLHFWHEMSTFKTVLCTMECRRYYVILQLQPSMNNDDRSKA